MDVLSAAVQIVRVTAYDSDSNNGGWPVDDDKTDKLAKRLTQLGLKNGLDFFFMRYPTSDGEMETVFLKTGHTFKRVTRNESTFLQRMQSTTQINDDIMLYCNGKHDHRIPVYFNSSETGVLQGDSYHPDSVDAFEALSPM